ncbi:hypothetical protein SG18_00080 [Pandoraea apista]|nr:hypothetical protein SG18_00080 [Pandoraea apista]AKH70920.1 hypothetical protein XM39_00080 [Pandoraea apista]AKI61830.1 hypothetical protein AA956_08615 [Pandoraea apista]
MTSAENTPLAARVGITDTDAEQSATICAQLHAVTGARNAPPDCAHACPAKPSMPATSHPVAILKVLKPRMMFPRMWRHIPCCG